MTDTLNNKVKLLAIFIILCISSIYCSSPNLARSDTSGLPKTKPILTPSPATDVIPIPDTNTSPSTTPVILKPPDPSKLSSTERDVEYGRVGQVSLKMDVYYPKQAEAPVPALLYVHGGAWRSGDKATGAGSLDIREMVRRNYLVAAINYRLAPQYKFPAMIEDVMCAVRHLRANAADYGIDPERLGVWGGSAGGHLVALLGTADKNTGFDNSSGGNPGYSFRVKAVTDMFGPADLPAMLPVEEQARFIFGNYDLVKASPVTHVSVDDPPFLILHGEKDKVVPLSQSQIFYNRLINIGVPATLVVVKNAGHGFIPDGGQIQPTRGDLTVTMADFFDHYLK